MKKILSVYFAEDRVYMLLAKPSDKGLILNWVGSTDNHIDFPNINDEPSILAARELEGFLTEMNVDEIGRISVTLPADVALITQFPGKDDITSEHLNKMVDLEIRQAYPQFNYDDFTSNIYKLSPKNDGNQMMLAVILAKQDFENTRKLLSALNKPVSNIEISQINSHSAFLYNYPERAWQTVGLMSIQRNFIDFSILKAGVPAYYSLIGHAGRDIGEILRNEIEKINSNKLGKLDTLFFFGSGLNKAIFDELSDAADEIGLSNGRLNAFRMMKGELDDRQKEYCSRTSHIFPACVGGCIPPYHEKIIIY
jgi:hypothetical protein